MKYYYLLFAALSLFLLAGCTIIEPIETGDIDVQTEAVTTTSAETTASTAKVTTTKVTTTVTTTAATTTAKPEPPADLLLKGLETVEAGDDLTLEDFITDRNVELKDASALLDTSALGSFSVEIPYLYDGTEFTQTLQYQVTDTTKPYIINPGTNSYHKAGTDFDLNQYIGYADNFDSSPVLTCDGEVDPDTVGAYPLGITVTDSSGNACWWEMTVNVVEEIPKSADTVPRVNYSDFISRYACDDVRFGIDVSTWQGDVDYNAVRDAGCSFVIIRVGYCYDEPKLDKYFRQNLKNAAAAGLDVGVYFYTTDHSEEEVREHVRWITEQLDGQELDLPIVFDWEEFSHFQKYGMSIRDLNDVYAAFADEVIKQGCKPMLYSSKIFLETIWSEKTKKSTPVWLAHYVGETTYEGEYAIWQQSAYGRIPGIAGDVDMNIQYLNKEIG
ncbi:MAG: glycoside hydrolase family 25 [Oscillospiraceae bacterium]|nr:glycoside hydrolase family 25 [Oscillospiraceae bacterium]